METAEYFHKTQLAASRLPPTDVKTKENRPGKNYFPSQNQRKQISASIIRGYLSVFGVATDYVQATHVALYCVLACHL